MRTFPDLRMRRLHDLAERGQAASPAEALELYAELERELDALGLDSAWVHWAQAVAHDNLGQLELALNAIRKSLEQDPLSAMSHRSFDIIVGRIRERLADLSIVDESIPKLYRLLQQSGDSDIATHLVMARHLAATSQLDRAGELLESLALMAPASREVWGERAQLARQMGDLTAAANFDAEAHARCLPDVPFAIPNPKES